MDLNSVFRTAAGSLANTAAQIATVSDNIAGTSVAGYSRREAQIVTATNGFLKVGLSRVTDVALARDLSAGLSREAMAKALSDAYDRMNGLFGEAAGANSVQAGTGALQDAIELSATSPSDPIAISSLVEAARSLAVGLNEKYADTLALRGELDKQVQTSVAHVNTLLGRIDELTRDIVTSGPGSRNGLGALDERDRLVAELSQEIGIVVRTRDSGDMAIFTSTGLTLYDKTPRTVSFQPTPAYAAATSGNAVFVDGVPLVRGNGDSRTPAGRITGLLKARDEAVPTELARLDEVARGLVESFAETDQAGGGKPPLTGLFAWSGGPSVPPTGTRVVGIAGSIEVNPLVDSAQGGDPLLLRDGGINGDPDYVSNTTGAASFSDRLLAMSDGLGESRTLLSGQGVAEQRSLLEYANIMMGAFDEARSRAGDQYDYTGLVVDRLEDSLASRVAPNLDDELAKLLELERSYQASAKVLAATDDLLAELMRSIG